jgi:hypothetical protein
MIMKKYAFMVVLLTILSMIACTKKEIEVLNSSKKITVESLENYIVFANVGLGWGCRSSVIYMVADGKIYADTSKTFCKDQENYVFSGYQLAESEYNKVKSVMAEFPNELSKEESKTFGCPGCADGGMLFLQYKEKGQNVKNWRIDDAVFYRETDVVNQPFPTYLSKFGQSLGKVITLIKYQ